MCEIRKQPSSPNQTSLPPTESCRRRNMLDLDNAPQEEWCNTRGSKLKEESTAALLWHSSVLRLVFWGPLIGLYWTAHTFIPRAGRINKKWSSQTSEIRLSRQGAKITGRTRNIFKWQFRALFTACADGAIKIMLISCLASEFE